MADLEWTVSPGDEITVRWEKLYNDNDQDDTALAIHQGERLVLFEVGAVTDRFDYPADVSIAALAPSCELLPEAGYQGCIGLYSYPVDVTVAGVTGTVAPGSAATVGDYQVLLGRYQDASGKAISCLPGDPYSPFGVDLAVYAAVRAR